MRILRPGTSGADVRFLQERLVTHGYRVDVDGDFGPETVRALEQFQAGAHLTVDGIVGDRTWTALRSTGMAKIPIDARSEGEAWLIDHMLDQIHRVDVAEREAVTKVLRAAIGMLGAEEDPPGSNRGGVIDPITAGWYDAATEAVKGRPPWCALALSHWFKVGLGVKSWSEIPFGRRMGGVTQITDWARARGTLYDPMAAEPLPGWIFLMDRSTSGSDASSTRAGHTGFIVAMDGPDFAITIEGNVGNAVGSRRRALSSFESLADWGPI
jgi:hypothetical protein